jgi:hypothetical protein
VATVTRTYRQIVADHRRHCPHQVKLANAGDWRDRQILLLLFLLCILRCFFQKETQFRYPPIYGGKKI